MKNYNIAGLSIKINCFGRLLTTQSLAYLDCQDNKADVTISSVYNAMIGLSGKEVLREGNAIYTRDEAYKHIYICEDDVIKLHSAADFGGIDFRFEFCEIIEKYPHLSLDEWEYIQTGLAFSRALLNYDGFCLHASAVALDNKAVLFSAPCGTGKSTQSRLWQQYFGKDRAVIINDDKPALRLINDCFYVYGTPWSGKSGLNTNIRVPLGAVVFLKQSKENHLRLLDSREGVRLLLYQSLRSGSDTEKMNSLLTLLDALLKKIPLYQLDCNISLDAVKMVYNEIYQ